MLRAAREAQGLHIAALAASIKVTQRKLEALEADRYDELPDATFTRALAQDGLPQPEDRCGAGAARCCRRLGDHGLEQVDQGLNTPFRERRARRRARLAPAGAFGAVFWLPRLRPARGRASCTCCRRRWLARLGWHAPRRRSRSAASSRCAPRRPRGDSRGCRRRSRRRGPATPPPVVPAPSAPAPAADAAAPRRDRRARRRASQLRASGESWVEVARRARRGAAVAHAAARRSVGLDGAPPFRVTIGNAAATQLSFRGQPVDLAASTRDNVARLELK